METSYINKFKDLISYKYKKIKLKISFELVKSGYQDDEGYNNKTYSSPYYESSFSMMQIRDIKHHDFSKERKLFKDLLVEKILDEILCRLYDEEVMTLLEPILSDKKTYER